MAKETLGQKQRRFTEMIATLILWVYEELPGYELTVGDFYRDPRLHGSLGEKKGYGHKNSGHKNRLAGDLNLFINGVYQDSTEAHKPIGEKWESMGGSWGGRFADGNHYSLEHNGVR
jgi:hypothetical protein